MTDSFDQLADDIRSAVGFRLLTALLVVPPEVERIYTNLPDAYPVAGRKQMLHTPWGDHVIDQGRIWHGRTPQDLERVFPDHALIASLGCGSCINIPVRHRGATIGTLNILDAENAYTDRHVENAASFADRAVALFRQHTNDNIEKDLN